MLVKINDIPVESFTELSQKSEYYAIVENVATIHSNDSGSLDLTVSVTSHKMIGLVMKVKEIYGHTHADFFDMLMSYFGNM